MNNTMLEFVKSKLEEGESVSPNVLSTIVTAAQFPARRHSHWRMSALLAASLAVSACGWLISHNMRNDNRKGDLTNAINLLRLADGETVYDGDSLVDNLVGWQDAPAISCE